MDTPGFRLDKYLAERCPDLSRSQMQRLIREALVLVNGHPEKPSLHLNPGDRILLTLPPPAPLDLVPEEIPLCVLYEDANIIVLDKPPGLVVHPAPGHSRGTLVNALLARTHDLAGIGGTLRPGIVHRLDKGTSGLMVVAKNDAAHRSLTQQIRERSLLKSYVALLVGRLSPARGLIEAAIGRDPWNRKRMAIVEEGREAITRYRVLAYLAEHTLVEATPETGRTHQIRVHFSAIGYPLLGDSIYGKRSPLLERQFLHACILGFRLPGTNEYVEFRSELPPDLQEALRTLAGVTSLDAAIGG